MAIISFSKDAVFDYIPEYGGNRGSDDPCIVRLKFLPFSKVQEIERLKALKNRNVSDPLQETRNNQEIQRRQFVENVESISGYSVEGREIKDPGEFYDTADTALVSEVLLAMVNAARLSEGQRKN